MTSRALEKSKLLLSELSTQLSRSDSRSRVNVKEMYATNMTNDQRSYASSSSTFSLLANQSPDNIDFDKVIHGFQEHIRGIRARHTANHESFNRDCGILEARLGQLRKELDTA